MKESGADERFQIAVVSAQNTEQINGQITLAEAANKTQINQIAGFFIQDWTK